MVNLLHNVEFNFHRSFLGASPVSANLAPFLVVVIGVGSRRVGELHMGNLQIILRIARRMSPD